MRKYHYQPSAHTMAIAQKTYMLHLFLVHINLLRALTLSNVWLCVCMCVDYTYQICIKVELILKCKRHRQNDQRLKLTHSSNSRSIQLLVLPLSANGLRPTAKCAMIDVYFDEIEKKNDVICARILPCETIGDGS